MGKTWTHEFVCVFCGGKSCLKWGKEGKAKIGLWKYRGGKLMQMSKTKGERREGKCVGKEEAAF
jgi:hypothetical protein